MYEGSRESTLACLNIIFRFRSLSPKMPSAFSCFLERKNGKAAAVPHAERVSQFLLIEPVGEVLSVFHHQLSCRGARFLVPFESIFVICVKFNILMSLVSRRVELLACAKLISVNISSLVFI